MDSKKVCSICGREFDFWDAQEDFTIERDLGYGTVFDGCKLRIHICCKCMEHLVAQCAVYPIIEE